MSDSKPATQTLAFLKFAKRIFQVHGQSLLLLLLGVSLPLFLFEQLAIVIWQNQAGFLWDEPVLQTIHATANPQLTQIAATVTHLGGFKGSIALTSGFSLVLLVYRRWRSLIYLLVTMIGSGLINHTAKAFLHRVRPSLWESVAPELGFAFPSGHASTSMTLVAALVILTWGSRWCWLMVLGGSGFVAVMGWTRLYLGVHFPSDILAGWLVSLAWAIGVSLVLRPLNQSGLVDEASLTPNEEKVASL